MTQKRMDKQLFDRRKERGRERESGRIGGDGTVEGDEVVFSKLYSGSPRSRVG